MKRTQIYLPPQQHDRLKSLALKEHTSVSEVIRKIVDEKLAAKPATGTPKKPAYTNPGEWLISQANWAKKAGINGPSDLSTNLDEYLYGDKK